MDVLDTRGFGQSRAGPKLVMFKECLSMFNSGIICLPETHISDLKDTDELKQTSDAFDWVFFLGTGRSNGVAVGVDRRRFELLDVYPRLNGRILFLKARHRVCNLVLNVLALYAPTREAERLDFWQRVNESVLSPALDDGDFNCIIRDDHASGGNKQRLFFVSSQM